MISRSSPSYSIIKLRVFLIFYIYYNKIFQFCQIWCIKGVTASRKNKLRGGMSLDVKRQCRKVFLFLIYLKYIRTDVIPQPVRLIQLWHRISDNGACMFGDGGRTRTCDFQLMRMARWPLLYPAICKWGDEPSMVRINKTWDYSFD